MNEVLFHSSWWLLASVATGGIAMFLFGNRRTDKNLQRIGLIIVAVAIVLGLMRYFFPTARERMELRSRSIVHAVDHHDWSSLSALLSPDTSLCNRSRVLFGGKDAIVRTAQVEMERAKVKSVHIIGLDSTQTDMQISVSLEIYSTEEDDRPITSTWRMDYEQSGEEWLLQSITLLRLGSDTNQDFNPQIPPN